MDSNQFLIDDVMDSDDLGLIDGSYPFLANMSSMSLLQQQSQMQQQHNQAMPPMHNQRSKGPLTHSNMPTSNQYLHHNQQQQLRSGHMSPGRIDVDMMNQNNPAQANQSSLFQAYASQFGLKQPTMQMEGGVNNNQHGDTSVEAYAALMGVKLESPRSMHKQHYQANDMSRAQLNAQFFESFSQQSAMPPSAGGPSGHLHGQNNMTSMTLPAGIGGGFHMNHHLQGLTHLWLLCGDHDVVADVDFDKDSVVSKADKSRERNRDHSRKVRSELNRVTKYQDILGGNVMIYDVVWLTPSGFVVPYQPKHSKGMYWKGELNARMCDQGIVLTTRVQRQPLAKA
ncbi:hypothetical protein B5M09_008110 [Aphanomyces astaci]|uniref:Uncharacterized protein n=1 Tax=Aphanomyces astaci TaxID=112090 RepID=A0A3R7XPU1_APHAT|nr:hypothetical protein B5M09_008110 [Aphanomyces astaci]